MLSERVREGAQVARDATLAQLVEQLIRNQQVVGSNPTGGSKTPKKYKAFQIHLGGHSVALPSTVRDLSECVKFCGDIARANSWIVNLRK